MERRRTNCRAYLLRDDCAQVRQPGRRVNLRTGQPVPADLRDQEPQDHWRSPARTTLYLHERSKLGRLTLQSAEAISATPNDMNIVHWPLMGGPLHLVQRGGNWAGPQPVQAPPRCTKCNSPPINGQCTDHRIAVYNCPLLCGFNVPVMYKVAE